MKRILTLLSILLLLTGCTDEPEVKDEGLTQQQFWNLYNHAESLKGPEGYNLIFIGSDELVYFKEETEFWIKGKVDTFEYQKDGKYHAVMHVPGFEGNEVIDPYEAYDVDFVFTINQDKTDVLNVKAESGSGDYYVPELVIESDTYYLEYEQEYFSLGKRLSFDFDGIKSEEIEDAYRYVLVPKYDGIPFKTEIFGNEDKRVIYSMHFASSVSVYLMDNYLVVASNIAKQLNGYYVEVFDIRELKSIYQFDDVTFNIDIMEMKFTVSRPVDMTDIAEEKTYTIIDGKIREE